MTMDFLDNSRQLARLGQFGEALKVLDAGQAQQNRQTAVQALRAELLERVGRHAQSLSTITTLIKSRGLTTGERAACEYTWGRLCLEEGSAEEAITHLRRAASLANEADDLERLCRTQLLLLLAVTDRSAPELAEARIAEIRANVTKLGDAHLLATLHLYVGELEAKRGFLENAQRHITLARGLLAVAPNVWLEAVAENNSSGICLLRANIESAQEHGLKGRELSERSSVASACCASLANLGNAFQARGDFEQAAYCYERALTAFPSMSNRNNGTLDGLARIRMAQGKLDECAQLLDQIESSVCTPKDRATYGYRYAAFTRTQLKERQNSLTEAIDQADSVLALAEQAGDELLRKMTLLTKADIQLKAGRVSESIGTLQHAAPHLFGESPDLYAQYERVVACACVMSSDVEAGRRHYRRSRRTYESIQNSIGITELERRWHDAVSSARDRTAIDQEPEAQPTRDAHVASSVLHDLAALMLHSGRPELFARGLVDVIDASGSSLYAVAWNRSEDGSVQILATSGPARDPNAPVGENEQRLDLGVVGGGNIELLLQPKPDVESMATINAVGLLVAALLALEQAHSDRERRDTLWQLDEVQPDEGGVWVGHMREQMARARRISNTNVSVLITGESGTGKELLARAIHTHSDRSERPFLPYNCAAVPRELLESQLFGHRRGAFTGADRNQPGVILSARGGTIFLDEIGELSLDLQPKLLRFLESGEICPVGESTPFVVDVRIVAATNANLEQLVKEGLFREDLFYRLDVIRLSLDPLRKRRDEIPSLVRHFVRRAAHELRKGQVLIAEEAMERLLLYRWPGNIRQLQNEVRRMVAFAEPNGIITPTDISPEILSRYDVPGSAEQATTCRPANR